ncbi:hypothetical protein M0Q50_05055 [bacterium]|jgi:hypothetical protein|nr:hypothetical protein [bacterium]
MSTKKFGIVASMAFALLVVVSPAFAACSLTTMSECDNNGLMSLIVQLLSGTQTQTTTTGATISGIPAGFTFTTNLKQGSTGNDVKYLQILLNSDAATSIGNKGSETTYFGAMTKAAVVKFQNKYASEVLTPYGLTAGTGFFGSASRTKANAMIAAGGSTGTVTTYPAGCTSATGYSSTTGQSCAGGTVTTPVVGGAFSVALSTDNPAATTLVQKQSGADLAHYTFSNGTSTPIVVTSVTLNKIGVSADSTLANVYLFDGAVRLTDAASVSSGKATFNATSGIFTIPANGTKTIAVKSDIADVTSGQTVGVALSAITSNGTLSSTLPISGNISTIASASLASVALTQQTNSTSTDPSSDVKVWESLFNVGTRNVQFTRLALKQINSIDSKDIQNFRLMVDGIEIAKVANIDSTGYITFVFDKTLTTGNKYVKVLADVIGGSSRKIQFSLRNKADMDLKDSEYNVNVSPTSGVPGTSDEMTVNAGNLTVTKATDSKSGKVPNNTSNVSLAKYTFKAAGEAIKIETLKAGFTYDDADNDNGVSGGVALDAATLRNGKILVNGAQVGSTATLLAAGTTFTVNFTVTPGTTATVEIVADIYDNDGTGAIENADSITANLISVAGNATRQISLGTIAVPSADTAGNPVIVGEGSVTLSRTSNYGDRNVVVPQTAFKIGSWTLVGSSVEDININKFSLDADNVDAGANDFTAADLTDAYLVYGTSTSQTKSTLAAADNEWSVGFTLAKNQSITIDLYANIGSAVSTGTKVKTDMSVTGTGALSGVTITQIDKDGPTLTAQNGSITVAIDASTPDASNVADENTIKTASYKFTAQNDAYSIGEINLDVTAATTVSNVILKYGSETLGSKAPNSDGTVTFGGLSIGVAANTTKIVDVYVELSTVGSGAGSTGENIQTQLVSALAGAGSTGVIDSVAGNPANGKNIYVYKALPTISNVTLPSSVLSNGDKTIAKVSINTNGSGTIAWKKLLFTVTKTAEGAATEGLAPVLALPTLWNADTNTQITAAVVSTSNGAGSVNCAEDASTCTFSVYVGTNLDDNAEEQISGAKTYELRSAITGTLATGDYVQTNITSTALGYVAPTTYTAVGATASFVWSDMSDSIHDTGTADWNNNNLIKDLPTSTQVLTK